MLAVFKKWDSSLIVNKPYIWLTRIHIIAPVSVLIIILLAVLLNSLPLHTDLTPILICTSLISLILLIGFLRFQYLYCNKNYTPKYLSRIFLINLINIFLILLITILFPFKMGKSVSAVLEENNFSDISDEIRIAMIPSKLINSIRAGDLDSAVNREYYYSDLIDNVKNNKFITQTIAELNLNSASGFSLFGPSAEEKAAAEKAVQDSIAVADSMMREAEAAAAAAAAAAVPDTMPYDSSAISTSSTLEKKDTVITSAVTDSTHLVTYNYSDFLIKLRQMKDEEITMIKQNINTTLQKFDFSKYSGDSTLYSLNTYYDVLNRESLNLYSTKRFYETSGLIFIILSVLLISLSQFSILLFNKKNFVLLLFSLFIFYGLITGATAFFDTSMGLYLLIMIVLIISASEIFEEKPLLRKVNIFCFNLLTFISVYLISLPIWIINFIDESVYLAYRDIIPLLLIVLMISYIYFLYKIFIQLFRRMYWINCLPRN